MTQREHITFKKKLKESGNSMSLECSGTHAACANMYLAQAALLEDSRYFAARKKILFKGMFFFCRLVHCWLTNAANVAMSNRIAWDVAVHTETLSSHSFRLGTEHRKELKTQLGRQQLITFCLSELLFFLFLAAKHCDFPMYFVSCFPVPWA